MKQFLANLRIRNKLLIGFLLIAVVLLVSGVNQYNVLHLLNSKKQKINTGIEYATYQSTVKFLLLSDMHNLMQIMNAKTAGQMDVWWGNHLMVSDSLTEVFEIVNKFREQPTTRNFILAPKIHEALSETQSAYLTLILPAFDNVNREKGALFSVDPELPLIYRDSVVLLNENVYDIRQTKISDIGGRLRNQEKFITNASISKIEQIEATQQLTTIEIKQLAESADKSARYTVIETALLAIIGLLFSFLVASFIANIISRTIEELRHTIGLLSQGVLPDDIEVNASDEIGEMKDAINVMIGGLRGTSKFASEIGKGKYDTQFMLLSDNDVLGNALLNMRTSLAEATNDELTRKELEAQRSWINKGVNLFGDLLRKHNDDMRVLGDAVISKLVKYLEANQGGLFVMNEENPEDVFLELSASYAFNRKKYIEKKILIGEGLVGMCALEKYSMHMTEIPEEYIEIESGLGDANPRSILIVPLKMDNQIFGVFEIASFKKFKPYEIELVEKVAENVASTLSTSKINRRTSELLLQSQQQAVEMHKQEELMKRSIEDISKEKEVAVQREFDVRKSLEKVTVAQRILDKKEQEQTQLIEDLNKQNEKKVVELEIREKRYRMILQSSLNAIVVLNKQGQIVFVNRAAENLWGYTHSELEGNSYKFLFSHEDSRVLIDQLDDYLSSDEINIPNMSRKSRVLKRNSTETGVEVAMIKTVSGQEEQVVLFVEDLAEHERMEADRNVMMEKIMAREFSFVMRIEDLELLIKQGGLAIPEYDETILIRWGGDFLLGIEIIDKQHRNWIELINKLYNALREGRANRQLSSFFDEVADYTNYHFTFEEKYFHKFEYENEVEHKATHQEFVSRLLEMREEFMSGKTTIAYELMNFLREWAVHHVQVTDRNYVNLFKKNGVI